MLDKLLELLRAQHNSKEDVKKALEDVNKKLNNYTSVEYWRRRGRICICSNGDDNDIVVKFTEFVPGDPAVTVCVPVELIQDIAEIMK